MPDDPKRAIVVFTVAELKPIWDMLQLPYMCAYPMSAAQEPFYARMVDLFGRYDPEGHGT